LWTYATAGKGETAAIGDVRERVGQVRRNPKCRIYKPDKRIGYGLCWSSMYIFVDGPPKRFAFENGLHFPRQTY
jgi:hypothetical protein